MATLPELYRDCEDLLAGARRPLLEKIRHSRLGGLSLREEAVTVRTDIMTLLASWSGFVVEETKVSPPGRRAVAELATFLDDHLDWLLAHSAALDFVDEIDDVALAARRAARPDNVLHIELGSCIKAGCDSPIAATTVTADGASPGTVECEAGHVFPPHQWLLVAHRRQQLRNSEQAGQ